MSFDSHLPTELPAIDQKVIPQFETATFGLG